jgi:polyisoprenoid-binding protein YceI
MAKQKWVIDPVHSDVSFKVRHMMITNVSGTFDVFEGTMLSDKSDFSDAEISFEAEIASINTRNAQRDEHLRSNDFFNASEAPKITFKSEQFKQLGNGLAELIGTINIRNVSKPITLKAAHTGTVVDPWGQVKAGFELSGSINRSDFGLQWSASSEDGVVVLAEEVKLMINAQLVKQQ